MSLGLDLKAIKMCPVVKELKTRNELETIVSVTGHIEDAGSGVKSIRCGSDYDLSIMKQKQTLFDIK